MKIPIKQTNKQNPTINWQPKNLSVGGFMCLVTFLIVCESVLWSTLQNSSPALLFSSTLTIYWDVIFLITLLTLNTFSLLEQKSVHTSVLLENLLENDIWSCWFYTLKCEQLSGIQEVQVCINFPVGLYTKLSLAWYM